MEIAAHPALQDLSEQLTETTAEQAQCSKLLTPDQRCTNPLDTEGSPKWCKKCRATYRREYEALKDQIRESRGHARGIQQLRNFLILEFERLGSGMFTGYEIAELIRQARVE